MNLRFYSAWRATAPYRVRIGLGLKGLDYEYRPVDLGGGEQHQPDYRAVNGQGLTPALDIGGDRILTQSLAILEWLEETHPEPPILPAAPLDRQVVRAMAGVIACDIHPLNNLRVLQALGAAGVRGAARQAWITRWMDEGFSVLEQMVAQHGGGFAFGETPTLADCCLVPQIYSAQRWGVSLEPYPAIRAVGERAAAHPVFAAAHPNRQPDAEKDPPPA